MNKKIKILLIVGIIVVAMTGCSGKTDYGFETKESLVYIQNEDSIISIFVEEFDKKKYSLKELKNTIEKEISEYNKEAKDGGMSFINLEVKDSIATLELEYKTAADYSAYNTKYVYFNSEIIMLLGTIDELTKQGISFEGEFYKIEEDDKTSIITLSDFKNKNDLKVLVLNEGNKVRVNGTIMYTSKNVSVKDGLATTTTGEYNYIIYKQKEVK